MKKLGEKVLYEGEWIVLKELHLQDEQGEELHWETIHRVEHTIGLIIIARLQPSDRVVLIRQYRPALNNYIIGFPAGIADSDDLGREALRELREETGYHGQVIDISPELRSNPALSSDRVFIVSAIIDEEEEQNQHPRQDLEPSEEIEVMLVARDQVREFLLEQHQQGDEIGIAPWLLFGLSLE
ncbi:MAG TPA: NUDIX hydrolase [Syntrophomonadaceae bacterium]|nr:NUDIX hydrolase [Syntrophomonadaceae bacterium]